MSGMAVLKVFGLNVTFIMRGGFVNHRGLQNRSTDGRNCVIEEPLEFVDKLGNLYRTETFLITDGGSIPPLGVIGGVLMFLVHFLARFSGWFELLAIPCLLVCISGLYLTSYARWWWSYILHDACYKDRLERWDGNAWAHCTLTEPQSNSLLYQAMRKQKAHWWEYTIVFLALHCFGWRAFDADRKAAARRARFEQTRFVRGIINLKHE